MPAGIKTLIFHGLTSVRSRTSDAALPSEDSVNLPQLPRMIASTVVMDETEGQHVIVEDDKAAVGFSQPSRFSPISAGKERRMDGPTALLMAQRTKDVTIKGTRGIGAGESS